MGEPRLDEIEDGSFLAEGSQLHHQAHVADFVESSPTDRDCMSPASSDTEYIDLERFGSTMTVGRKLDPLQQSGRTIRDQRITCEGRRQVWQVLETVY